MPTIALGQDEDHPLKVAVLVDLRWRPEAGGHVKCWERLAEAAMRRPAGDLDLTVHFEGDRAERVELAPHVRYQLHRPVFSSSRLPFLSHVPDHTDLAPWHPGLLRGLGGEAVIHTTDAFFAFAATAERLAARRGVPLVHSVHTDTPSYTRVFMAQTVERLAGRGALGRMLTNRLNLPERSERAMLRRLVAHQTRCRYVLASRPLDRLRALAALPAERVRELRRGIDCHRFHPRHADRCALIRRFGLPAEAPWIVFAGRLDRGKNIMVLVDAVQLLVQEGKPVHLVCVGGGVDGRQIAERLGPAVTCTGSLCQEDLARIYASADLFASPSLIEIHSNVVQEAMCSGLPVAVAAESGSQCLVAPGATGTVVRGSDPRRWADALRPLIVDRDLAAAMGSAARAYAEGALPSWDEVLAEDLLPVWRAAANFAPPPLSEVRLCWPRAS